MKKEIQNIYNIIEEKQKLEEKLENISQQLKNLSNEIKADSFNDLDYEAAIKLYKIIHFYLTNEQEKVKIISIIEQKKIEKYPELLKPTYYPEIDTLNISDSEKLRLDKAVRYNTRCILSKSSFNKNFPLSVSDLELLKSIGIVKKKYSFKCSNCGCFCNTYSEEELNNYKRLWELESLGESLTDDQKDELNSLSENGYYSIDVSCFDCEDEYFYSISEITCEKELKEYESFIEETYKIIKAPDLKYEKL